MTRSDVAMQQATSAYRAIFPKKHAIIPVIHVESASTALHNVEVAHRAGCDGVFLINHSIGSQVLLGVHARIAAEVPGYWVGVNCLDLGPEEVFRFLAPQVSGVWVDNARIDEHSPLQPLADRIEDARKASGWNGLYFGGVAFKYQRAVDDLRRAARQARPYMDVVTTSGPGTGRAATVEKIRALREGLGDWPLAIASGITPANVGDYLGLADCFLVATGISKSFTELDPDLTAALVAAVRSDAETAE